MLTYTEVLRKHAHAIAEAAAEDVDGEHLAGPLLRIVSSLADGISTSERLDLGPLRAEGADDRLIARLLRAVEIEAIESLRRHVDAHEFAAGVLALRACIRRSLPPSALNPDGVRRYQQFTSGEGAGFSPEARRLVRFLKGILKNVRDLIFVLDLRGNFLYVNERGLELVKYSKQDLAEGISVYDVVPSEYIEIVEQRMAAPPETRLSPFTVEIYAKDAKRIPMEIDTRALIAEDGALEAVVGIARDLRLERRFQDEIQRANCRLQSILEHASIGILLSDSKCQIEEANETAARLCGAPNAAALIGRAAVELLDSAEGQARREFESACRDQRIRRFFVNARSRFGERLHCDVTVAPMVRDDGACDGVLILLADVKERVHLREAIVQSEKLSSLGEIVARAAHELNNPLTGIIGYVEYLSHAVASESQRDRLDRVLEEAHRCRRIVENLLAFARRGETQKQLADVNGLIREALSLYEYALQVDKVALTLDLQSDLPPTLLNPQDMQRAFLNLINNAHQALLSRDSADRRLTIRTAARDGRIHVVFEDNGPGIDEEIQQKVFDPFFTTRKVGEGMGLGLSVAYAIARDHDGAIDLESEAGRGATFTIRIPLRAA